MNNKKLNTDNYEVFENPKEFLEALDEESKVNVSKEDEEVFIEYPDGKINSFEYDSGVLIKGLDGLSYLVGDIVGLIHELNDTNSEGEESITTRNSLAVARSLDRAILALQGTFEEFDYWKEEDIWGSNDE